MPGFPVNYLPGQPRNGCECRFVTGPVAIGGWGATSLFCSDAPRSVIATRYVTPLREGGSLPAIVEADDEGMYVAQVPRCRARARRH